MDLSQLTISTERLLIRPFTLDDIEASYQMNLDAEVSKYTGDGGVVSKQEIERRITEDVLGDYTKHGFGRLVVELKATQEFIGFTGLKYIPELNEVDLGYRLMSQHWGKGYATESAKAAIELGFEKLGLKSIIATVLPDNQGSIKVLNKLNFQFEKEIEEEGESVHLYRLK
ncbi:GNAT family N-acetyltransferase [Sanyastnella coralliicola]|uniref:GNAT family N-acetyltransferase n=1 Tax=Sanyastnella coralliicola TaxID=3069118 RepID=UPI0027B8DA56|nr:GNAT family N-acetyltransferase [Longitalea sp. SCSIO 12813]